MWYFLRFIFLCSIFFITSLDTTFWAIDFSFTPIKYELEMSTGSTLIRPATLENKWTDTILITTWKSDFQSNGTWGTPSFVRKSELVFPDQELSTWISIDTPSFSIAPWEKKTINFTINVPINATPGGHYGAIFFNTPRSWSGSSGDIWINIDYWVLILVNIQGDIVTGGSFGGATVSWGSSWAEEDEVIEDTSWIIGILPDNATYDDCPLGDFTNSNFDQKCFDNPFIDEPETENNDIEDIQEVSNNLIPLGEQEDFGIWFEVPFENTGNTHIKPKGKITLKDSKGNVITWVGKESITNQFGAVVWEKIVNYIPVNDIGGNVLPGTKRIFDSEWKWFPYKQYDIEGNQVINYWNPSEYYTRKNKEEAGFLMFWERVSESRKHEKITAIIDLYYTDENGEEIEFSSAQDFYIDYTQQYIGLNPYVIIPIILLWILLLLLFIRKSFMWGKKKRKCKTCKAPIRTNWRICPKCQKKIK